MIKSLGRKLINAAKKVEIFVNDNNISQRSINGKL